MGAGQVAGSWQTNAAPWRFGRPDLGGVAGSGANQKWRLLRSRMRSATGVPARASVKPEASSPAAKRTNGTCASSPAGGAATSACRCSAATAAASPAPHAAHVHRRRPASRAGLSRTSHWEAHPGTTGSPPARRRRGEWYWEPRPGLVRCVGPGPGADVHGGERRARRQRLPPHQRPECLDVEVPVSQRRVHAPPAPPVPRGQAQVGERRTRPRCEQGVQQLEQGVPPPAQAGVQPRPERPQRLPLSIDHRGMVPHLKPPAPPRPVAAATRLKGQKPSIAFRGRRPGRRPRAPRRRGSW